MSPESLVLLAQHFGLDPEYQTVWGHTQQALPTVLRAALDSVSGRSIPEAAYQDPAQTRAWLEQQRQSRWLPHPILAEDVQEPLASLRLPQLPPGSLLAVTIRWENGQESHFTASLNADSGLSFPPELAASLSSGYHRLRLSQGSRSEEYDWVLSPARVWEGDSPQQRSYGLSCFVPSLRSARNWGCGDFRDLVDFAAAFADAGFDYLALNPLHALANRVPYNASPYSPLSLLRLNFLYLDLENLPEFSRSRLVQRLSQDPAFQTHLASLRARDFVDYEGVARTKDFFLRLLYREYLRQPSAEYLSWRDARQPWLAQYGRYQAFWRYFHRRQPNCWIWQEWPAEYHDPASPASTALAARLTREIDFHAWVQWCLERQLAAASQSVRALGYQLGLYADLAVACDKAGPDRWANPTLFAAGIRIGSPPDDFNHNGQDWGFPALRPLAHCSGVLAYFRESLRAVARSAGIIRLDHVMRLARLYSIPDAHPAREGVYVRDQFLALLRIVALESHRHQALVVGEDLGTVPDYFRAALDAFGILSYRLLMFEWYGSELKPARDYPPTALCSFSTHDLPSFDGYLSSRDLAVRRHLGFLDDHSYSHNLDERRRNLAAFARAFGLAEAPSDPDTFFAHLLDFLLATPCRLVLLSWEELLGEAEQMNMPGTTSEYPNWQRKMRLDIPALRTDSTVARRLAAWQKARTHSV